MDYDVGKLKKGKLENRKETVTWTFLNKIWVIASAGNFWDAENLEQISLTGNRQNFGKY